MDGFERCSSRGSATSDFLGFVVVFGLSFVLGTHLFVPWLSSGAGIALRDVLRLPSGIARELSQGSGWGRLRWAPALPDASPPRRPETYTVERGDTLFEIALAHGVDLPDLASRNRIVDADRLRVGQVLVVRESAEGRLPVREAPPSPAPPTELAEVAALLTRAEGQLAAADFAGALGTADAADRRLAAQPDSREVRASRARVELVRATAQVAFGDSQAARSSFRSALELDPELRLDAARTSPKILRVFRQSQGGLGPGGSLPTLPR